MSNWLSLGQVGSLGQESKTIPGKNTKRKLEKILNSSKCPREPHFGRRRKKKDR